MNTKFNFIHLESFKVIQGKIRFVTLSTLNMSSSLNVITT